MDAQDGKAHFFRSSAQLGGGGVDVYILQPPAPLALDVTMRLFATLVAGGSITIRPAGDVSLVG
jgi:hypothetical protein